MEPDTGKKTRRKHEDCKIGNVRLVPSVSSWSLYAQYLSRYTLGLFLAFLVIDAQTFNVPEIFTFSTDFLFYPEYLSTANVLAV